MNPVARSENAFRYVLVNFKAQALATRLPIGTLISEPEMKTFKSTKLSEKYDN